ncbi:MAG: hypothetical protein MUE71_00565 [Chitinophagaceae bacterium]|jgi:hypothetical protein|nr:hypothetical protein [Chitinophagaceae bacterium]
MGITIHYKGKLNDNASLNELIEEVKDIAEIMQWKFNILDTDLPENNPDEAMVDGNLYGIVFTPENCDPVWLTFLSNRRLCSAVNLPKFSEPLMEVDELNYWCFTKTQSAGVKTHESVVAFLKYISKKYFEHIEVDDEGNYWNSGDSQMLLAAFQKYSWLMDSMAEGLSLTQLKPGESVEDAITRVFIEMQHKNRNT